MRLLLTNPSNPLVSVVDSGHNHWNRYTVWKPLGLLVVAGLTPDDWETVVYDENVRIPDYESLQTPDLVGITAFTSQADRAYEIAAQYRARGVKVVMGGIHATMCPEEALEHVDAVITGEAESVWRTVLEDAKGGTLAKRYDGTRIGLDNVPAARHDLLPDGYRFGSIQTTRGCPLSCGFCSVTAFNGKHYRRRPIEQVIDEYRAVREKLVLIVDDNFIGTRADHIAHTKKLLHAMIDSGVRKKWIAQVTLNFGDDPELLALSARAGCVGVFIGFESVSAEGLREVHKQFNVREPEAITRAVSNIQRKGIAVVGSFIIGLDIDRPNIGADIASTATRYGLDAINILFLTPLPGTRLWDEMSGSDRILLRDHPRDWRYFTLTYPVARYNHLTWSQALTEKDTCHRSFYTYAGILRRVFNSLRQGRNPFVTLATNFWYRSNTLRLDTVAYRDFDVTPGEVSVQGMSAQTRQEPTGDVQCAQTCLAVAD